MIETFLITLFPNLLGREQELIRCFWQTVNMSVVAGIVSFGLGLILGVVLIVTRREGIMENSVIYNLLDKLINLFRSIPFIILMALLIPLSRMIMGSAIGVEGAYIPLIFGTVPFFSRQIESALSGIDKGLIEASAAMGFSPLEIIFKVYLKESVPSITRSCMITFVNLVGLTAMAGAIGAGGLGDYAVRYGHQNKMIDLIILTIILILFLISIIQVTGNFIIKKTTH